MKTPLTAPSWREHVGTLDGERLVELMTHPDVRATVGGRYRHWDALRHLPPPEGLTHEEWWTGMKLARSQVRQPVGMTDVVGRPFEIALVPPLLQRLSSVDQQASGRIAIGEHLTNPATRNAYLVTSLEEEAIRSSQLEGATTSRRVAKEMLRSGRPPRSKSEQMILNNFHAMNFVRDRRNEPLTPEMVLELHRIVTTDTLDDATAAGRLQLPDEERVGMFDEANQLLHQPPDAALLPDRLERLCAFANASDDEDEFLHPVLRSLVLHFWVGYDHPFEDGNGRTARTLFYWSMLHHGYWLTEFLAISGILEQAPAKYARAYLYTERDENDFTYFALYQLEVIQRAIAGLEAYLQRKAREVRQAEALLRDTTLNHRQIALLGDALRNPGQTYTIAAHARSHGVVYQSARTDLLNLEDRGLVVKRRRGRAFHFYPIEDLQARLAETD